METLERIIDEEIEKESSPYVVFKIRERIFREVAEGRAGPDFSARYHDALCVAIAVEMDTKVRESAFSLNRDTGLDMSADAITNFLHTYERCQTLCEFLMDEYENLSPYFRENWEVEHLMDLAARFHSTHERMSREFAKKGKSAFPSKDIERFGSVVRWTCVAVLGEEAWCHVIAEAQDTIKILVNHPKLSEILRKE